MRHAHLQKTHAKLRIAAARLAARCAFIGAIKSSLQYREMLEKLLGPPSTSRAPPQVRVSAPTEAADEAVRGNVLSEPPRLRSDSDSSGSMGGSAAYRVTSVDDPHLQHGTGPAAAAKYAPPKQQGRAARRGSDIAVDVSPDIVVPPGMAHSASFTAVATEGRAPTSGSTDARMPLASGFSDANDTNAHFVEGASVPPLLTAAAVRQARRNSVQQRNSSSDSPVRIWGGSGSDAAVRLGVAGAGVPIPLALLGRSMKPARAQGSQGAAQTFSDVSRASLHAEGGPTDAEQIVSAVEAAAAQLPFIARVMSRAKLLDERPELSREQASVLAGLDVPAARRPPLDGIASGQAVSQRFRSALASSIAVAGAATPRGRAVLESVRPSISGGGAGGKAGPVPAFGSASMIGSGDATGAVETQELLRNLLALVSKQQRQIDNLAAALGAVRPSTA